MNQKRGLVAALGVVAVLLACVTASSHTVNTPLYTYRMEQQSSYMNFLPTAANSFTYHAEKGCTVNYDVLACCSTTSIMELTIRISCETCYEPTCFTCPLTCLPTCDDTTCKVTCGVSYCVCPTLITC